jgi:hypothetical protein
MKFDFNEYVKYRGKQFEKLFKGKKKITYITDPKKWLKLVPEDKKNVKQRDGLAIKEGYVFVSQKIPSISRLDAVILEEVAHVYNWKWTEHRTRRFVKKVLGLNE